MRPTRHTPNNHIMQERLRRGKFAPPRQQRDLRVIVHSWLPYSSGGPKRPLYARRGGRQSPTERLHTNAHSTALPPSKLTGFAGEPGWRKKCGT